MEIKINYPPRFQSRYGYGRPPALFVKRIIEAKRGEQLAFLRTCQQFREQLSAIPIDAEESAPDPRWNQSWFPPLDGISLYGMIAICRPRYLIEIGSGNSTKFARRAMRDHGLGTQLVSIDPQPRAEIDGLSDRVLRVGLEDADPSIFSHLAPGDIVFFDGSHRCLQNSDVTVFFVEVLPALAPGVIVGIHDIFWPNDYPEKWIERYYSEQYVLAAYMLAFGTEFPLILSGAWCSANLVPEIRACLSEEALQGFDTLKKGLGGGSLWFQKPDVPFAPAP